MPAPGCRHVARSKAHADRLRAALYGNPHSANPTSMASTELVASARRAVLEFVGASADDYAVIFTANATGACRLVAEAYPFKRGQPVGTDLRQPQTPSTASVNSPGPAARRSATFPCPGPNCASPTLTSRWRWAAHATTTARWPVRRGLFAYAAPEQLHRRTAPAGLDRDRTRETRFMTYCSTRPRMFQPTA